MERNNPHLEAWTSHQPQPLFDPHSFREPLSTAERDPLQGANIEEDDPNRVVGYALSIPRDEVLPIMLSWYRSDDLWKVVMASHYFNRPVVRKEMDRLFDLVRSSNSERVRSAMKKLARFGEVALHRAVKELSGPLLEQVLREIFLQMEDEAIPRVLKSLRRESFSVKMNVVRALTGIGNRHALPILLELMREVSDVRKRGTGGDRPSPRKRPGAEPVLN